MPLIDCPECGRQISTAAVACPQCGHPNEPAPAAVPDYFTAAQRQAPESASRAHGPSCYACDSLATTRCQSCGKLSCALHLQNIFVSHGRGGSNELRCSDCYASAKARKLVGMVVAAIVVLIMLIIFVNAFY